MPIYRVCVDGLIQEKKRSPRIQTTLLLRNRKKYDSLSACNETKSGLEKIESELNENRDTEKGYHYT